MKKRLQKILIATSIGLYFANPISISAQYPTAGIATALNKETFQSRIGIAKILDTNVTMSDLICGYVEEIITDENKERDYTVEIEISKLPEPVVIVEEPIPVAQAPQETIQQIITSENRWGIILNDHEIYLLACITWLESGNQSDDGQQAVITVILNRMTSPLFPNSLEAVLSQKNPVQFTTWAKLSQAKPDEKVYRNINAVLEGRGNNNITTNGWLFFNGVGPSRATVIGDHKFWT